MNYRNYTATITVAEDGKTFKGLLNVSVDIVKWYADTFEEFEKKFHQAVDQYIEEEEKENQLYDAPYAVKGATERGFAIYTFEDSKRVKCSLQKSSAAEDDCIWLGATDIGLKEFVAHRKPSAWVNVELEDTLGHHYVADNRMHLNRDQVKALLPILKKFVDTGEI